ncbi:MAG: class I SAM-dependent methyltransferase [Chloroflexi bacterium]|nr:class I SAM-dependent methyltransferase [Chloroflexota bacterium]
MIPRSRDSVAPIIGNLAVSESDIVLDICTGQGGLLFNILDTLDKRIEIVSVDMSLTIQSHNRCYLLENYGDRNVSFISCDAAHTPFKHSVFSHVVSFAMGNMLDRMDLGVREVARILRDRGTFVFNHMYVAEDSKGWGVLKDDMLQNGKDHFGFLGLEKDFVALVDSIGFRNRTIQVTNEVIGDPDRDIEQGPIFPYPNEHLTEIVVKAVK